MIAPLYFKSLHEPNPTDITNRVLPQQGRVFYLEFR